MLVVSTGIVFTPPLVAGGCICWLSMLCQPASRKHAGVYCYLLPVGEDFFFVNWRDRENERSVLGKQASWPESDNYQAYEVSGMHPQSSL